MTTKNNGDSKKKIIPRKRIVQPIFMPNEIFHDLISLDKERIKTNHMPFLYSYYYYICYLYRYCMFFGGEGDYTQQGIKETLGYSRDNKTVDYLIKKEGVLDSLMQYTITTNDFPFSWSLDDQNDPVFTMINELKNKGSVLNYNAKNYRIKYPIKAFFRNEEDHKNRILTGTFYNPYNTHRINYDIFEKIMGIETTIQKPILFYIYGYLKFKNDIHGGKFPVSLTQLVRDLNVGHKTITNAGKCLEDNKLITVVRQNYNSYRYGKGKDSNIYIVN